jgi:Zn-dependent protease with chaperone function
MRTSTRALQAVGLLLGFYLVTLGTLAALAVVDIVLVLRTTAGTPVVAEGKVIGATAVIALPLVRGLLMSRPRRGDRTTAGVRVTPQDQPELWARVTRVAEQVGTRPPAEIHLVAAVNAAVSEDTHLMGLLPGRRRMFLGVPLLLGMTTAQLDAVLAHELGHYGNHDVRLAATTVRGMAGVQAVAGSYTTAHSWMNRLMRDFFSWYAHLYQRVSYAVRRRQELAADGTAARIAGRDHTAAALRQLPALDAAYGFYVERYASIGWDAGLMALPEEFFSGLYALLAEPSRQRELDELRREPPDAEPHPYDSHPPLSERLARIEALPDDRRAATGTEQPALTLLRGARRLCARVAEDALSPEAAAKRPVDWDELARGAGRAALVREADQVLRTASSAVGVPVTGLPGLLDAIDRGWLGAVAEALPK